MAEVALYDMKGKEIGSLSLPDSVFGVKPNVPLLHQAVTAEAANQRQGTADTRTRGEIRGGGRKPWRQKGTGRARQGSTRAPHWRHGGVVFGPHPRSYRQALPKRMRRGAICAALSARVADGELIGIDALHIDGDSPSTKQAAAAFSALPLSREMNVKHYNGDKIVEGKRPKAYNVLVIVPEYDGTLLKSCRNIPHVTLRYAENFSVRDVMSAGRILLAKEAVAKVEQWLAASEPVVETPKEAKPARKRKTADAAAEPAPVKKPRSKKAEAAEEAAAE